MVCGRPDAHLCRESINTCPSRWVEEKTRGTLKTLALPADRRREPSPQHSGRTPRPPIPLRSARHALQYPTTSARGGDPARGLYGCPGTWRPRVSHESLLYTGIALTSL